MDLYQLIIKQQDGHMNLNEAVYRTIHRSKGSVDSIACQTGINKNTLYRYALPADQSGLDIPLTKLVPLMNASQTFDILRIMALSCGFLLVKVPRSAQTRMDESEIVGNYQKVCHTAVEKLMAFFHLPTKVTLQGAIEGLNEAAAESIAIKKRCEKHQQREFDF